jgi:hypothetical protein
MAIDIETRQYYSEVGVVLTLRPISSLVLERLALDESDRPAVPMVEVTVAGHKVMEPNPQDPAYIAAETSWHGQRNIRILQYTLCEGVAEEPPPEFTTRFKTYFPHATPTEMKYLWIVSACVKDHEEVTTLSTVIASQRAVTQEAVQLAADRFPSNGGRAADNPVSLSEITDYDNRRSELRIGAGEDLGGNPV